MFLLLSEPAYLLRRHQIPAAAAQEAIDEEKQEGDSSRPETPMTPKSGSVADVEPPAFKRLQSRSLVSNKFLTDVAKVRGAHESPYATRSWEVICKDEAKVMHFCIRLRSTM